MVGLLESAHFQAMTDEKCCHALMTYFTQDSSGKTVHQILSFFWECSNAAFLKNPTPN